MPLGTKVGLVPGHIVLDGIQLPPTAAQPPIVGQCLLWPNGRLGQLLLSTCYFISDVVPCIQDRTLPLSAARGPMKATLPLILGLISLCRVYMILSCKVRNIFAYVQGSSAVISVHVAAGMHPVLFRLVFDVEDPVFDRQPVVITTESLLPLYAQSVAARRRQKVKPLQSHPEVQRVAGTKPVLVIIPCQVPVEPAR